MLCAYKLSEAKPCNGLFASSSGEVKLNIITLHYITFAHILKSNSCTSNYNTENIYIYSYALGHQHMVGHGLYIEQWQVWVCKYIIIQHNTFLILWKDIMVVSWPAGPLIGVHKEW